MSVIFFDGVMQQDIVYRIEEIQKTQIVFQKQEIIPKKSELDFEMILVQALPNKFSKLEYIVQKCSEVGFSQIVFFSSERSQKLHISDQKMKRLTSIMIEAIEQSNRNSFCDIALYDTKQVYDAIAPEETHIVFHPDSQLQATPIREISIKKGQTVRMYV